VDYAKTPCSEFPNDNPDLHNGSVWYAADEDDSLDSIEILDELVFESAPEDEPAAQEPADPFYALVHAIESTTLSFGGNPDSLALMRAMLGVTRIETLALDLTGLEALVRAGLASCSAAGVARSERFTREVLAWQDILREKSDDFAACGAAMLDEWASELIAGVLGGATRADAVRRELRKHGVAAFGLLAAA